MSKSSFNIYPNPATDHITLSSKSTVKGNINITITNLSGKIVYSEQIDNQSPGLIKTIKLPELVSGTYLVNLVSDGKSESKKLIVN